MVWNTDDLVKLQVGGKVGMHYKVMIVKLQEIIISSLTFRSKFNTAGGSTYV
jgi:hypothetical protein